ncbi:MAG: AAA family ATPase [Candidatus Sericytochromatia bacterium]|nr:AAA family ATPase [Candidatus Tanganyikabacteria bacterium]
MRIRGWTIASFGALEGVACRDLGPGLTVFVGPNGSGKSTTLRFLTFMLFGPGPSRGAAQRPGPDDSSPAGVLELEDRSGPLLLRRQADTPRVPRLVRPDGGPLPPGGLMDLLGPIDRALYASVHAFGLQDLQALQALADPALRDQVLGAASAGGTAPAAAARELEAQAQAICRPRGACLLRTLDADLAALVVGEAAAIRQIEAYAESGARLHAAEAESERLARVWTGLAGVRAQLDALPDPELPPRWTMGERLWAVAAGVLMVLAAALLAWGGSFGLGARPSMFAGGGMALLGVGLVVRLRRDRHERHARVGEGVAAVLAERAEERRRLEVTLEEVDGQRGAALCETARLIEERRRIEEQPSAVLLAQRRAELTAAREEALQQWRRLVVARAMVEEAARRFTASTQDRVLARAGRWLEEATSGALRGPVRLDADGAHVETDRGGLCPVSRLSRGTAELLYLCLRLALAVEVAPGHPLPLLMDDILVNLDPDRAEGAMRLLATVACERQILVFTCHADRAVRWPALAPEIDVRPLPVARGVPA